MNTETLEQVKATEEEARKAIAEAEAPMRAHYFDRHGNALGDANAGEAVAHIPEAKQRGRSMGAAAFRLWLGKEAEEKGGVTQLYYIQPWLGARYQSVQRTGFFRYLEKTIAREERRERIQIMRSLTDPAYKHEVEEEVSEGGEG